MALHSTAHEFFSLLSQGGLENGNVLTSPTRGLPPSMEDQLEDRFAPNRLEAAVARVDFEREQARQIVSQASMLCTRLAEAAKEKEGVFPISFPLQS